MNHDEALKMWKIREVERACQRPVDQSTNARAQNGNHELQNGISTVPRVRARFDQSPTAGCSCGFIKVGGFIQPSNKHGGFLK